MGRGFVPFQLIWTGRKTGMETLGMIFYIVITKQRGEKETENKGEGQISNSNFIKNRLQFHSFHEAILFQTLYIKNEICMMR